MNQQTRQNIYNASQAYFQLVASQIPTEAELTVWLDKLASLDISQAVREELRSMGPVPNWSAEPYYSSFRGFVAEHRNLQMVDYLAEHLSPPDFAAWVDFHGDGPILGILAARD